eukprot:89164-Prymnesium_polylepis.1
MSAAAVRNCWLVATTSRGCWSQLGGNYPLPHRDDNSQSVGARGEVWWLVICQGAVQCSMTSKGGPEHSSRLAHIPERGTLRSFISRMKDELKVDPAETKE